MRNNIRVLNLVSKLNYISRNTNLYRNGSGLLNASVSQQSQRNSSSGHGGQSEFGRSTILYSLLGAGITGGVLAYYFSSDSKPAKKTLASSSQRTVKATPKQEEEPAAVAEEEQTEESVVEEPVEEKAPVVVEETKAKVEEKPVEKKTQKVLPDIPNYAQYLIVGGGTAAMSAFKAIRASDPNAKILVVTEESYKPYMRPPLSKDLWTTEDGELVDQLKFKMYNGNVRSLFFLEDEFYVEPKYLNESENGGVAVLTGKRVTQVDIQNKTVRLDNNWEITYDKCLIATGGKPRNLACVEQNWDKLKDRVTLFRNIDDFKRLHAIARQSGKTIAVVGGGFLGSELACALSTVAKKNGSNVIQVFPESGILRKVLPEYLSEWTTARVRDEGVSVVPNVNVTKVQLNDEKVELSLAPTAKGQTLRSNWLLADHIVVAIGLEPNVQLAKNSGFEIDPRLGGYVVNAELQARNSIWVAGDAACFYDIKLGRRRVEHHDHAVVSGRLAGENMTGAGKPYWHQSMFWSDIGPKIGFEAIGLVDSSLQTVGLFAKADKDDTPAAQVAQTNESLRSEVDNSNLKENAGSLQIPTSKEDYGKGVVLYVRDEQIVGVLLWNLFKRIPIARQLIQQQERVTDFSELAKLFKIDATGLEESSN